MAESRTRVVAMLTAGAQYLLGALFGLAFGVVLGFASIAVANAAPPSPWRPVVWVALAGIDVSLLVLVDRGIKRLDTRGWRRG